MEWKKILIVMFAAMPLLAEPAPTTAPVATASAPTTQPSRTGRSRKEFREPREPTEEEWKEVEAFMEQHSPNRLEQLQKLKETAPYRATLRARAAQQYRNMKELQRDDATLYEIAVKRFELKDDQFHLGQEYSHARGDARLALRDQLKKNASDIVELNLREREYRLNKLAETVDRERKKLAEDKQNKDQLVLDQLHQAAGREPGAKKGGSKTTTAEAQ